MNAGCGGVLIVMEKADFCDEVGAALWEVEKIGGCGVLEFSEVLML